MVAKYKKCKVLSWVTKSVALIQAGGRGWGGGGVAEKQPAQKGGLLSLRAQYDSTREETTNRRKAGLIAGHINRNRAITAGEARVPLSSCCLERTPADTTLLLPDTALLLKGL